MKVSEIAAAVSAVSLQLEKAKAEIMGKIEALEAALTSVELPAEAIDAIAALTATAQALDDIVPDAVVTPPAGE